MPDNFTALFEAGFNQLARPEIAPGQIFGPFKVVKSIGHGGMGSVYLGERADNEYHQQVAIKIFPALFAQQQNGRSLNSEAQALASLSHPNLGPVLDAGRTDDNLMFIVMRLVEGLPLNEWLQQQALTVKQKLKLLLPVLDALQHAHSHQILHADIKPQNILVDEEGVPYLVDFGIAHLLGQDHGPVVGQYAAAFSDKFASPEQLAGERLTTATDIYSAGKLISAVVTHNTPTNTLPRALQCIIDTATHPEPGKRYLTVHALQTDVERFLAHQPVSVLPDLSYRSKLWLYRQRYKVASATITAVLLGITAFSQYNASNTAKQSENALAVVQHLLGNVDRVNNSEVERQRDILSTSEKINIDALSPEQAAPVILAQAEAYQILGNYKAAVERAERLRQITEGKTSLIPYYTVALRFLAEEDMVNNNYYAAIDKVNLIIDALKAQNALTSPVYEKLLIWIRTVEWPEFLEAKYHILQCLENEFALIDGNQDFAHLKKLIEAEYLLSKRSSITKDDIQDILSSFSPKWPLQLQIMALKTLTSLAIFDDNQAAQTSLATHLNQLEQALGTAHPAILELKFWHIALSIIDAKKRYTALLEMLETADSTNNANFEKLLQLYKLDYLLNENLALLVHENATLNNYIESLTAFDNGYKLQFIIYLLTEFDKEELAFRAIQARIHFAKQFGDELNERIYSYFYCAYINEYHPPTSKSGWEATCKRAEALYMATNNETDFWLNRIKIMYAEGLIVLRDGRAADAFEQLTRFFEEQNVNKSDRYYRVGAHLYLWKNELDKAEVFLNAIDETTLPYWSYGDFVYLKATLLFKQGNIAQAVAKLDTANERLCRKFSHDDYRMRRIRQLRADMQLSPVDTCPDAVSWQDLDPNGEIEANILRYIKKMENFQPAVLH